jgi:hypothetical protein
MRGWDTSRLISVGRDRGMALTRVEKERVSDSRLKIQSVNNSLKHVDPKKLPHLEEIRECLDEAEESLTGALSSESDPPKSERR